MALCIWPSSELWEMTDGNGVDSGTRHDGASLICSNTPTFLCASALSVSSVCLQPGSHGHARLGVLV